MKVLLIVAWVLIAAATVHAQDAAFTSASAPAARAGTISAARDLYASARYDEALAMLNSLRPAELQSAEERRLVEQYRALCLLALGRVDEAQTAIEAVVTADPFYQPGEAEASPRVRTTFADVRQRLLPTLTSARYASAKTAYDRKEFKDAERRFREVMQLLDDPQMGDRLADLRVVVAGFVELATAAAAPPPPPKVEEPPPAPVPEPAPRPAAPRIFTSSEPNIVVPSVLRQEVPPVPPAIASMVKERGVIELVIDEQGRVTFMAIRSSVHPIYDSLLLAAAKEWKYKPATLNGGPVPFRKLLQVTIAKR
jgi:TonB family protein